MKQTLVPKRPYAAILMVWALSLLAAPTVGVITSYFLAPGSLVGLLIGFLWLWVSYKISYYAWMLVDFLHDPPRQY